MAIAKTKTPPFVVVCDSREQCPWDLPGTIRGTLATGDYSIYHLEDVVALERKSLDDLYGSLGKNGRDRFKREFERLAGYRWAALVIEATWQTILTCPPKMSGLHPHSAVGALLAWSIRYGVHIIPAGDRQLAQRLAYEWLHHVWRQVEKEKAGEAAATPAAEERDAA